MARRFAVLLSCAIAIAASPASTAGPSVGEQIIMAPLFGNTLQFTDPSSAVTRDEVYQPDHSWAMWVPGARVSYGNGYAHPRFRGVWKLRPGGRVCVTYHRSKLEPRKQRCAHMIAHHVGDRWASTDGTSVTLLDGIK